MIVSRADLEASLAGLAQTSLDRRAGIHGPGTHAWSLGREAINFLGGPRAALLQLAHPYVAYAIDQHSATRADVQGRFQRTFANVFAMTMGDLDSAFVAARRVHAIHTRIHGTIGHDVGALRSGHRYQANESSALLWVWATLIDTMVQVHELWVRPLTDRFKDQLVRESHRFAALFAIPPAELPPDWAAFRVYMDGMLASDLINVAPPALEMSRFLLQSPRPMVVPLFAWIRILTAGLLPARLRDGFELPFGATERAVFATTGAALRPLYRLAPRTLRWVPAYQAARARVEGRPPPRVSKMMERLAVRGIATATHS
ncbi:MAG TPA: oxygenase MpaB family protein [Kofleriaceae bacterium]|nr:oxygenase MpaB family protein [Kofleriaceae bacterium]